MDSTPRGSASGQLLDTCSCDLVADNPKARPALTILQCMSCCRRELSVVPGGLQGTEAVGYSKEHCETIGRSLF